MDRILKKIIVPTSCLAIATPLICINTSCEHKHVDIESIKLSSRFSYIYPDHDLKIKASIYPASASLDDLQWEILDSSGLDFKISQEGWLTSPKTYTTNEPFSVYIKCSSKLDPSVYATFSVLATTDTEHEFLGFTGGVSFLNRDGSVGIRKILNKEISSGYKCYYLEKTDPLKTDKPFEQDGIDLYVGDSDEYIDFKPVFKTGNNTGMMFDLFSPFGYSDDYNCVTWVGYKDNTVTPTIPQFLASTPTFRKQYMNVSFTADSSQFLWLVFDVFLDTPQTSPAIFNYDPKPAEGSEPQGEDEHSILPISDGAFKTQILCPTTQQDPVQKRIGDIYVYRKPYENLNTIAGRWEPSETAPDIFTDTGKPRFTKLEFGHHLPNVDWYEAAILTMTYTVDPAKLTGLDYEDYFIGSYRIYDIEDEDQDHPIAWLDFRVSWVD